MKAAANLIGRTGAAELQIRCCDEDQPVIWMAVARWKDTWQAAGALNALDAVYRLLNEVIDGGMCAHCKRPSGFEPDTGPVLLDQLVCWYQFDPSTKTFARGCAG